MGLVAWKALGPPGVEKFDAADARAAFREGRAAMLIDRAERVATWSGGKPVGVAGLPGSERVYEPMQKEWKPGVAPESPELSAARRWLADRNQQEHRRAPSARRPSTSPSISPAPIT